MSFTDSKGAQSGEIRASFAIMPGWRSGYRVSLENSFPKGFPGSNPGPGVLLFGILGTYLNHARLGEA
jgi:hypothetical protein